jgi:hypothetical protein
MICYGKKIYIIGSLAQRVHLSLVAPLKMVATTFSITTLYTNTLNITTPSIINDTQHAGKKGSSLYYINVLEYHYLSFILSVVAPSVIMQNVVAPKKIVN